jgi:formate dehydrogenase major subunit
MPRVTIDGTTHEIPAESTLLHAMRGLGLDVPHLCHDDRLKPYGACRLCLVEVAGEARPVTACDTAIRAGMDVRTHTPALERLRRTQLQLMAARYPATAVAAEPDLPFHRELLRYDVTPGDRPPVVAWTDDTHPYLGVDMNRCIHCNRCVRICDEVQGQFVWQVWERGERTHVRPASGASLLTSGCTSCGACTDTCPSGALFDKQVQRLGAAEDWTTTTCVYCAVGCQMEVGRRGERVVAVRPANGAVNRGHLCSKGRYAFEFASSPERVTRPMIRRGGDWEVVGWDDALDYTAERLRRILAAAGPDAVGVLGSARATNEENYLIQKFARVVAGTNNVDCCARVCHAPSAAALKSMLGAGAATNSFDDIERAALILICGASPTENHPIVGARIKQAVLRGAKLVVIDPRRIELAHYADIHLALRPGRNVPLLNAMACTIIEEGLFDRAFIAARVDEMEEFTTFVRDFRPEAVAAECGVTAEAIRAAARLYAQTSPAMCFHGLGVTEHVQGTEGVMALIDLALLTGNVGKPGAGINPLRGQNNVQGAAHMGCDPGVLTGSQDMETARERFESVWGAPIPRRRGLSLLGMMDAAAGGRLAALWAFGYDIYLTLPDAAATARALGGLELLIVQDLFLNETARAFGTVFLPAASVFERDGTFMNSDRRVQRVRRVVPPPGEARPDLWIICELARRLDAAKAFDFTDAESVWNEVRAVWPAGAGLSYPRLERESLHWPCPTRDHPGTPILHAATFGHGHPRTALRRIPYVPTAETVSDELPYLLCTGRHLYHFNAGTMTYRTPNALLRRTDTLQLSSQDATRLGVRDGDAVVVRSRYGEVILPAQISDQVTPGVLYTTFHDPASFVNRLTSPVRDRLTETPEYKVTAVTLSLSETAASPPSTRQAPARP